MQVVLPQLPPVGQGDHLLQRLLGEGEQLAEVPATALRGLHEQGELVDSGLGLRGDLQEVEVPPAVAGVRADQLAVEVGGGLLEEDGEVEGAEAELDTPAGPGGGDLQLGPVEADPLGRVAHLVPEAEGGVLPLSAGGRFRRPGEVGLGLLVGHAEAELVNRHGGGGRQLEGARLAGEALGAGVELLLLGEPMVQSGAEALPVDGQHAQFLGLDGELLRPHDALGVLEGYGLPGHHVGEPARLGRVGEAQLHAGAVHPAGVVEHQPFLQAVLGHHPPGPDFLAAAVHLPLDAEALQQIAQEDGLEAAVQGHPPPRPVGGAAPERGAEHDDLALAEGAHADGDRAVLPVGQGDAVGAGALQGDRAVGVVDAHPVDGHALAIGGHPGQLLQHRVVLVDGHHHGFALADHLEAGEAGDGPGVGLEEAVAGGRVHGDEDAALADVLLDPGQRLVVEDQAPGVEQNGELADQAGPDLGLGHVHVAVVRRLQAAAAEVPGVLEVLVREVARSLRGAQERHLRGHRVGLGEQLHLAAVVAEPVGLLLEVQVHDRVVDEVVLALAVEQQPVELLGLAQHVVELAAFLAGAVRAHSVPEPRPVRAVGAAAPGGVDPGDAHLALELQEVVGQFHGPAGHEQHGHLLLALAHRPRLAQVPADIRVDLPVAQVDPAGVLLRAPVRVAPGLLRGEEHRAAQVPVLDLQGQHIAPRFDQGGDAHADGPDPLHLGADLAEEGVVEVDLHRVGRGVIGVGDQVDLLAGARGQPGGGVELLAQPHGALVLRGQRGVLVVARQVVLAERGREVEFDPVLARRVTGLPPLLGSRLAAVQMPAPVGRHIERGLPFRVEAAEELEPGRHPHFVPGLEVPRIAVPALAEPGEVELAGLAEPLAIPGLVGLGLEHEIGGEPMQALLVPGPSRGDAEEGQVVPARPLQRREGRQVRAGDVGLQLVAGPVAGVHVPRAVGAEPVGQGVGVELHHLLGELVPEPPRLKPGAEVEVHVLPGLFREAQFVLQGVGMLHTVGQRRLVHIPALIRAHPQLEVIPRGPPVQLRLALEARPVALHIGPEEVMLGHAPGLEVKGIQPCRTRFGGFVRGALAR